MSAGGIILWVGPKHSGKTTMVAGSVGRFRTRGLLVGGILAPSLYRRGRLVGFDVVDLYSGRRAPLLRLGRPADVGRFAFRKEGLELGRSALDSLHRSRSDLVIVDEFGPLELSGKGWRKAVDRLIDANQTTLLLVVRQELCDEVSALYASKSVRIMRASVPTAPERIEQMLLAGVQD